MSVARQDAAMAQVVEHVLGKDEVTSSNLVSSSIKKPECGSRSGFCLPAKPPARARERQISAPQAQPFSTPKNSLKNCVFSVDFYKRAWYNSEGNMVYYPILLYAERIWKDMKKLSACLLALVMMVALCVPSFAGNAVNALTDVNAKEIGDEVVTYVTANGVTAFEDDAQRAQMVTAVVRGLDIDNYGDEAANATSVALAVEALQADYPEALTAETAATLQTELLAAIGDAYDARPGVSTFDPSQVGDNIASGFTDSDLSGLFDSLRNAVTDLGDRLEGVFRQNSGGGEETTTEPSGGEENTGNGTDYEDAATGDTAVFAVAGVAAVSAIALVLSRKKKSK